MATFKHEQIPQGSDVDTVIESYNSLVRKLIFTLNNLDEENIPSLGGEKNNAKT